MVPKQLPEGDGWGFCSLCNEHGRVMERSGFNICFNCLSCKDDVIDELVDIIVSERANYRKELSAISDACQQAKKGFGQ